MKSKKTIALLLALIMVFALFSACGKTETPAATPAEEPAAGGETPAEEPSKEQAGSTVVDDTAFQRKTAEGELVVGTAENVDTFNPVDSFNSTGMYLIYDTLLINNPDTGELEGLLAEKWEYRDSTHLYIKLRDTATFALSGEQVTAEDCLWSMQRILDEGSRWSTFVNAIDFANCEIISDTEFVIAYVSEFGPGLSYLATRYSSALNKSYVEEKGAEVAFWSAPDASGPYVVSEMAAGSHQVFTLREDYDLDTSTMAKKITVKSYAESSTMLIDYESGNLDAIFNVDTAEAERLVAGEVSDTEYRIQSNLDVYGLALPEYCEYFDDIRVRQAIACAVDWEAVSDIGLGCLGGTATSILPAGVRYKIDCGTYEYDVEKAKSLMKEAGYEDGFDLRFVLVNDASNERMATAIQAYLQELNITVSVEAYDIATAVPIFMAAETDLVINSMGCTSLDPDQQLDTAKATSTNATVKITDPEMDGYLMTGRDSIDEAVREENYKNAQQWMYDNIRQVTICEVYACYAYRPYITSLNTISAEVPNLRFCVGA